MQYTSVVLTNTLLCMLVLLLHLSHIEAWRPCPELSPVLRLPCRCNVVPFAATGQLGAVSMDCDHAVFHGEAPPLPYGAPIVAYTQRYSGQQTVPTQILTDLVQGEFMQLGSKETENERFAHYLTKTYRKTASLIANALKATAIIASADENLSELAFQYGRNIGLAFQLVDDLLDFVSSTEAMGKPTAADLKLGLATAPVLFACEKYPELNPMIMRRFSEPGDVERAFELVHKSHGLEQTRFLAKKHCIEAIRLAQQLTESPYQKGLQVVADLVINRMK